MKLLPNLESTRNKLHLKLQETLSDRCFFWLKEGFELGVSGKVLPAYSDWKLTFINKGRFKIANLVSKDVAKQLSEAYYELFKEGYERGQSGGLIPSKEEVKERYYKEGTSIDSTNNFLTPPCNKVESNIPTTGVE
jgi:hypothetical protein